MKEYYNSKVSPLNFRKFKYNIMPKLFKYTLKDYIIF